MGRTRVEKREFGFSAVRKWRASCDECPWQLHRETWHATYRLARKHVCTKVSES